MTRPMEAEAAYLGRALSDPSLVDHTSQLLDANDFALPVHSRIYACILKARDAGLQANPVSLAPYLKADEGLKLLGGTAYLARLTGNGAGSLVPDGFAGQIAEFAARRRRLEWLSEQAAICHDVEHPLAELDPPSDIAVAARPLACLDLVSLAVVEPQPKRFVIPSIAPAAEVTLFTGAGGVGKSLLAQQFATCVAAGVGTLGIELSSCASIYLTCEDDAEQLHWRQAHICRAHGIDMADLAGRLHLLSLRGAPDNSLAYFDSNGRMTATALFTRLTRLVRDTGAGFVCLDNVAHLFAGNENDRSSVTRFVNLLNRLAGDTGAAVLLMGHPNKGGDTYSGSTGWLNAVRSQVFMSRVEGEMADPDLRVLTIGKPNYVQAGEAMRFRWHNWAFVPDNVLFADNRQGGAPSRQASEEALFMACLAKRAEQERAVSDKHSPTFAPTVFSKMPESKGIGSTRLEAAMERLIRAGKIERAVLRRGSDRKPISGLRAVDFKPAGDGAGNGAGNTLRETRVTVA